MTRLLLEVLTHTKQAGINLVHSIRTYKKTTCAVVDDVVDVYFLLLGFAT
jgi:hypothetical protein